MATVHGYRRVLGFDHQLPLSGSTATDCTSPGNSMPGIASMVTRQPMPGETSLSTLSCTLPSQTMPPVRGICMISWRSRTVVPSAIGASLPMRPLSTRA